jgi:DNA invertase Pin-like site-specific DNA recombinase
MGPKMSKLVGVNEKGLRVGQDHQRAKLTDRDVELIRSLHEDGMSYSRLAKKFEVAKSTVQDICTYRRRAQAAVKWRKLA